MINSIVFVPKGRKKELYGKVRKFLGSVFHALAAQRRSEILAGHMGQDHVHMLIRIPPKYSVAEVGGSIKGKSAIAVARQFGGRKRNFNGETFWARGDAVSTVGCEEEQIRRYLRNQEQLDAQGRDEDGDFSESLRTLIWQPLGLLTTVKPPALRERHDFEVIVGKSTLAFKRNEEEEHPSSKRFGFVQTLDTKPKRRLYEVLQSQGMQLNQQITFLSDGSDTVRELQLYMSPEAEHILDWFHVSMKLTVLDQYAKGLVHCEQTLGEEIRDKIERLKWSLWHGNLYKAFYKVDDIESLLYNFEETYPKFKPLLKAVEEFRTYIVNNAHLIPNYGERYRNGEAIATGFVVSTVNQVVSKRFCKKQQMQWTKRGAHLLLQTRVRTLNGELGEVFKRWYPDMQVEELAEAA